MNYLDFQVDVPVFVRSKHNPLVINGVTYEEGQNLPWQEINLDYETVRQWWLLGMIHHNQNLEKEVQVGDRLAELDKNQLEKMVDAINALVKERANSTAEFTQKRCKKSRIDDKQRGLLRSFLRNNSKWVEEDFYMIRDKLLE